MLKKAYVADVYVRLSREDGDKEESDSISNQKMLILNFIKDKPDIKLHKIRVDDGFTGTNFDRPSFQEMIADVKSGKVNCIIVKDLSRFGRNYVESGKYITNIFPFLNVRFIAVNDNFDTVNSINSSELTVFHFKNLLNDAYCNDISVKVRSQLDIKRKNGEFIGATSPYGYLKSAENKNALVVDESVVDVIQNIFAWKLKGLSALRIAKRLNELGISTPMEHKKEMGIKYSTSFCKSITPKWKAKTVTRILSNRVYIGVLEQGKSSTPNYKIKKRFYKNEEDWFVCENNHQSIIDIEIFNKVQELLKEDTRVAPNNDEIYLFSGIAKCGKCEGNLTRKISYSRNGKDRYYYYICLSHKNKTGCENGMYFPTTKLEQVVLASINAHIRNILNLKKVADMTAGSSYKKYEIEKLMKEKSRLIAEHKTIENKIIILYEDLKNNLINKKEYKELKKAFNNKKEHIEISISKVNQKYNLLTSKKDMFSVYEQFTENNEIKELSRELLISLVDKILIFDKENIEICFKYQSEYDLMRDSIEHKEVL
jgi:DNA invertase Pin-like site-specific DNA recombinase